MARATEDDQPGAVGGAAGSYEPAGGQGVGSALTRRRISQVVLYVLLIIGALIAIFPMLWMLSASVMPTGEASTYPPHFLPSHITFSHYRELFTRLNQAGTTIIQVTHSEENAKFGNRIVAPV